MPPIEYTSLALSQYENRYGNKVSSNMKILVNSDLNFKKSLPSRPEPPAWEMILEDLKTLPNDDVIFTVINNGSGSDI